MDPHCVAQRCRETWPDWTFSVLEPFSDAGWDYAVFQVDGAWLVRVPRTAPARTHLAWEMPVLDRLAPTLPLAVPHYVRRARWAGVYRRLPGAAGPSCPPQAGAAVGRWLAALHAAALEGPPSPAAHEPRRQRRWQRRFAKLGARLDAFAWPHLSAAAARAAQHWYRGRLAAWEREPPPMALIHGDLAPEHLLAVDGRITGVIDFGDLTYGDPALDFAGLGAGEPAARAAYGAPVDDEAVAFYRRLAPLYGVLRRVSQGESPGRVEALMADWARGARDTMG